MYLLIIHYLKGYALCHWPLHLLVVAILGAWWLHFDRPVEHFGTSGTPWGVILAPRNKPGGPWEQQDGHEVARNRIFIDFEMILGPYFESFLDTEV